MSDLNPHQFGDQGTLFHAPLGQPFSGVFKGNPHARIYRNIGMPSSVARDFRETGDVGVITDHITRTTKDVGIDRSLGFHWQHDLSAAKEHTWGPGYARVVVEADHPGHEHVLNFDHDHESGPMEDHKGNVIQSRPYSNAERALWTPRMRDYHAMEATVGPHSMKDTVLPEVPIRPGAPLNVHAVHLPAPSDQQPQAYARGDDSARIWNRHPVQFKGRA